MRPSTITSILLALVPVGALAGPTPAPPNDVDLTVNLQVQTGQRCERSDRWLLTTWNIWVDHDDQYNEICGNQCLASFRGRCGHLLTGWECERNVNAQGQTHYHFHTPTYCSATDMSAALHHCLGGTNLPCIG